MFFLLPCNPLVFYTLLGTPNSSTLFFVLLFRFTCNASILLALVPALLVLLNELWKRKLSTVSLSTVTIEFFFFFCHHVEQLDWACIGKHLLFMITFLVWPKCGALTATQTGFTSFSQSLLCGTIVFNALRIKKKKKLITIKTTSFIIKSTKYCKCWPKNMGWDDVKGWQSHYHDIRMGGDFIRKGFERQKRFVIYFFVFNCIDKEIIKYFWNESTFKWRWIKSQSFSMLLSILPIRFI